MMQVIIYDLQMFIVQATYFSKHFSITKFMHINSSRLLICHICKPFVIICFLLAIEVAPKVTNKDEKVFFTLVSMS